MGSLFAQKNPEMFEAQNELYPGWPLHKDISGFSKGFLIHNLWDALVWTVVEWQVKCCGFGWVSANQRTVKVVFAFCACLKLLVESDKPLLCYDTSVFCRTDINFPGGSEHGKRPRHCETIYRSALTSNSLTLAGRHFSVINQPLCWLKVPFLWYEWYYVAHLEVVEDLPFFFWGESRTFCHSDGLHFSQMTSN